MPTTHSATALVATNSDFTKASSYVYGQGGILKLSPIGQEMVNYLPQYMQDGDFIRKIQETMALEISRAISLREDMVAQFFVESATWGLKLWEELAGLPVGDATESTLEARRGLVKSSIGSRRKEGEYYFKKRLEDLLGVVYINDLDPQTNPYEITVESVAQIVENPPTSNVTAAATANSGSLNDDYTYKVTYVFPTGETTAGQGELYTNEIQSLGATGTVTGGTFTITFDDMLPPNAPPNPRTTNPIPWNATDAEVQAELELLSNLIGFDPSAIKVTGGPAGASPLMVEFVAKKRGTEQVLMTVDSTNLIGGTYSFTQTQAGNTQYGTSESNTVSPASKTVLLTNVPVSPDGAIARNIYRKCNGSNGPSYDYLLVGSLFDNATTEFVDNVDDSEVLTNNVALPNANTAANQLGVRAAELLYKTKPAHIKATILSEAFRASINTAGDRV